MRPHGGRLAAIACHTGDTVMKRHKRLWARVASFENVEAAAREALRGKRTRGPGARFFTRPPFSAMIMILIDFPASSE